MASVKTKPVHRAAKKSPMGVKRAATQRLEKKSGAPARRVVRITEPQLGFSQETFDALLASRASEPEWMRDRRRDSFHVLLDTPVPTRTDEAWRRTDFGALKMAEIEAVMPKADGAAALKGAPRSIREAMAGKGASGALVAADGQIVAALLDRALARRGVIFTDMETALKKHSDLLEPLFMTNIVRPNAS